MLDQGVGSTTTDAGDANVASSDEIHRINQAKIGLGRGLTGRGKGIAKAAVWAIGLLAAGSLVDSTWWAVYAATMLKDFARREQLLQAAAVGLLGSLLLIAAGLIQVRLRGRRMRETIERGYAANARFAATIRSSADAIIDETLGGVILSWNPAAEKIFGFSAAEVEGRCSELLEPPDRCNEMAELRSAALANRRVDHIETQRVRKDGQRIEVSISLAVIKDTEGVPVGIVKIARDITKQKQALAQLRKSQATLADAQRIAHVGSWNWDLQTDEIQWSDEHFRIWGLKPQECTITAEIALSFIHPEDLPRLKGRVEQAIQDHQPYQCRVRVLRKDGTVRIVQSEGQAVYDASGKPIYVIGTAQDVTLSQLAEDKIQQLNCDLERRVEERTAALRESEERFRQFAETTSDVFWMMSIKGDHLLYVSPSYEKIWGRSCRDVYDNPQAWLEAIVPEDREAVKTSWLALAAHQQV